jgi:2-oxoglutarate ferredoxin oxidoreductase subunit beta
MLEELKEQAVPVKKAAKMTDEELEGKIVTGILTDKDMPEYTDRYTQLIDRLAEQRSQ